MQNREDPVSIHVHLGAHATSESFIQSHLETKTKELQEAGTCYIGPKALRAKNGVVLPGGQDKRTPEACAKINSEVLVNHMVKHSNDYELDNVIISASTFLGSTRRLVTNGDLYPDTMSFLQALPHWLNSEHTTFFLSTRHLGDMVSEELCRIASRRKFPDTDQVEAGLRKNTSSWVTVVDRIFTVFDQAKLVIWKHEDFSELANQVVRLLTKNTIEETPTFKETPLLSEEAFRYLEDCVVSHGKVDLPALRTAYAEKHFPISKGFPPFSITGHDERLREVVDARYRADWLEISRPRPNLTILPRVQA
jgi:hypothetical protein